MVFSTSICSERESSTDWLILASIVTLGAFLRFWGLGNIGLHGDEEIMGLAVKGILDSGSPVLPSGMYYARGLAVSFLMAASAQIFGLTEWALRFPSAMAGTIMILASYFLGKRFLPPNWSLVFSLVIALLPAMISISQTARFYVFYLTFVVIFAVAIFRWERSESLFDYALAFLVFLIALHCHRLSIFSSLLFFFPGVLKTSWRLFALGGIAFVACNVASLAVAKWTESHHYSTIDFSVDSEFSADYRVDALGLADISVGSVVLAGIFICLSIIICVLAARHLSARARRIEEIGIISAWVIAFVGAAAMHYHIAVLSFAVGTMFFLRCGGRLKWPVLLAGVILLFATTQILELWQTGGFDRPKEILMTMLGAPNPWPYLRFAAYFPLAVVAYIVMFSYYVILFVRGYAIPDHIVLVLIGVWAPIFLIGFFDDHIPLRYVVGFVPLFILAVFAGLHAIVNQYLQLLTKKPLLTPVILLPVLLALIRPSELWYNVNAEYSDFSHLGGDDRGADHKGAADFIKSVKLEPTDIVIAEDIIQQTYYLGKVDYYLKSFSRFTYTTGGVYADIYTGTPHIGNATMLQEVIDRKDRGAIYVIGSAETSGDPNYYLGSEMLRVLERSDPEVVYEGRDGKTKVLRIPSPDVR